MKNEFFDAVLHNRLALTRDVLASKAKEYAADTDRMHNFTRAAALQGCTKEQALVGMWTKHLVSILDIADATAKGKYPLQEMTKEKIGDAINYLVLLEAMLLEKAAPPAPGPVQFFPCDKRGHLI